MHRQATKFMAMQRQNDILSMLLDGKETKEIAGYLVNKYRYTYKVAENYISQARQEIKKRHAYEAGNMVLLHAARYEAIYQALVAMKANGIAMRALTAKEKLLGFHKQGFHMRVTQGQMTLFGKTDTSQYDPDKRLTPDKRQRLEELLLKCRTKNA